MSESEFEACFAKAARFVAEMDEHDGWADRNLSTIIAALQAGLIDPSNNAHFDALVMLIDLREIVKNGGRAHA